MSLESNAHRHYDPTVQQLQKVLDLATKTSADPEVISGLQTALRYAALRDDYAEHCSSRDSETCREIAQTTMTHPWAKLKEEGKTIWNLRPVMLSGKLEGQFLQSLVSAQRARRVLEVGTYTGYAALAMAEALPEDGHVVTLDLDPYLLTHNQPLWDKSPHGAKISMRIGPAIETMKKMTEEGLTFDFIFLDAEKSEYIDYLKLAIDGGLLAENGTIAVDNAFRHGQNYFPSDSPPDASRLFGEHVTNDARLHKVLVPIRDGVTLIRRVSDVKRDRPQ